jgi:hypothetical protein
MHEIDAGRIFWKEWRAQRSFWLGLFALAIGLEVLLLIVSPLWRKIDPVDQLRLYQVLVVVLACCFATGSAAIAFAGEVEGKTKGLLQRLPVRPRDLLAGKLSLALAGSYALLVALWVAGGLMLMQSTETPFSRVLSSNVSQEITAFWMFLLGPFLFVVIGGLFSLILSDVLLTVLIAGLSTAALLSIPMIRDHLSLQAAMIAVVAVCDFFLTRRWLHDAGTVQWTGLSPFTHPPVADRSRRSVLRQPASVGRLRSSVAWRRGASSLLWKEFRQAFPFFLKLLAVGLITLACVPYANSAWNFGFIPLMLIVFAPLLPGVAAIRAERRDDAFRLLSHHGVAADGFVVCKYLVWLSLSLLVFAVLLLIDRGLVANPLYPNRWPSLWNFAAGAAMATFDSAPPNVTGPLAVAAFHVVLLYALGFLLGLLLRSTIMAFFMAAISWLGLAFCWVIVASLRIPFWWTIGLFPVILLAATWVRTGDWLIGRDTPRAWGKVMATLGAPLVCMLIATAVFRMTEIPAVAVPPAVLESERTPGTESAINAKQSLFIDAIRALHPVPSDSRPVMRRKDQKSMWDGWQYATPSQKAWVAQNAEARRLALEAAQHAPGSFPPETVLVRGPMNAPLPLYQKTWGLAHLLLASARKLESENQLDQALLCYVAVARLGQDISRSGVIAPGNYAMVALDSMQPWAAHPKQTTDRVKRAIREFEPFETSFLSTQILRRWQVARLLLREFVGDRVPAESEFQTVSELWWTRWLIPWELVRLERLLDATFAAVVSESETVESELRTQGFVARTPERIARWNGRLGAPWTYERTTLAPPQFVDLPSSREPELNVNQMATQRMDLLALAIADFKREHRQRPASLQELVPLYFPQLPIDPWTGRNFHYEPQGVPVGIDFEPETLAAETPFLASAGLVDNRIIRMAKPGNQKPRVEIVTGLITSDEVRYRGANPLFVGPIVRLQ